LTSSATAKTAGSRAAWSSPFHFREVRYLNVEQRMILLRQGDFSFSVDIFRRWRGMRAWWAFLVAGPIMIAIICRGANGAPDVQPPSKWVKPLAAFGSPDQRAERRAIRA
jgi:hypothetical protein